MTRRLSPAQRKAVSGADPATGRLAARPDVCTALVAAGLAVPHGRGGHHSFYLTTDGRRLREALAEGTATGAAGASGPAESGAPRGGSFVADDGTKDEAPSDDAGRRAAEVAAAWEGLLQIRAVLMDGATGLPAPWEKGRAVHAVALALEAAGCPPARPGSAGYRVTPSTHTGLAEVTWSQASSAQAALAKCAALLSSHGWQATAHRTRDGDPYLLTSPATR